MPIHRVNGDWQWGSGPLPRAAGVLLLDPSGRALFLRRGPGGDHPHTWCLPGGGVEADEGPLATAARELKEETGYAQPLHDVQPVHEADEPVNYVTFGATVDEPYVPAPDDEHTAHAWAPIAQPPQPLHPGLQATLQHVLQQQLVAQDRAPTPGLRAYSEPLAYDRSTVRTYDRDGRLHVAICNISKANVCPYRGNEIPNWQQLGLQPDKMYQLLRHPDELAAAVPTFNNLPLLSRHVAVTAVDHHPELVVGSTGTDAEFTAPYLRNSLVLWAQQAVDDVQAENKKELSCAYRYRADMTPGEYEGTHYDGVMRDIVGNHVALVSEGRAGADVVVGDSKQHEEPNMKTLLTRRATLLQGALIAHLGPKLAQDAKLPDFKSVLVDVTSANYNDKKSVVIDGIKQLAQDKKLVLAQDADLSGLAALVDAFVPIEAEADPELAVEDDEDPAAVDPAAPGGEQTNDAEISAKVMEFLKGKLSAEDMAALTKLLGEEPAAAPAEKPGAQDDDNEEKDMVTKPAMDAAIQAATQAATEAATQAATKTQREIRDAERFVRPWVGDLALACDSAEQVHRSALDVLGVKHKDIHASALHTIIELQPQPGSKKQAEPRVGMDAASAKGFADRYPDTKRIRRVG